VAPAYATSILQPLWAGISAFIWYAFGTIPLQIAVAEQLRLEPAQASSWICIVWLSGAVSSIGLRE
jgi:predicted benzoate:H+ symporter BenE